MSGTRPTNLKRKRTYGGIGSQLDPVASQPEVAAPVPAPVTTSLYSETFSQADRQLSVQLQHRNIEEVSRPLTLTLKVGINKIRLVFSGQTDLLSHYFETVFAGKQNNIGTVTTLTYSVSPWRFAWLVKDNEARVEMWFPEGDITDNDIQQLRMAVVAELEALEPQSDDDAAPLAFSMETFHLPHAYYDIEVRSDILYSQATACVQAFIQYCETLRNTHQPQTEFEDKVNVGDVTVAPPVSYNLGYRMVGAGNLGLFGAANEPSSSVASMSTSISAPTPSTATQSQR